MNQHKFYDAFYNVNNIDKTVLDECESIANKMDGIAHILSKRKKPIPTSSATHYMSHMDAWPLDLSSTHDWDDQDVKA